MINFSEGRFRHGCTFLRVREDKLPKDCLLEQVVEHAAIQNINAFIEAGLATAGKKQKMRDLCQIRKTQRSKTRF